jgi:uncharacterized protein with GYD domain
MSNDLTRFLMLGTVSTEHHAISDGRAHAFVSALARQMGGNLHEAYALLGPFDVAFIVDLPSRDDAVKVAVAIGKQLGLSISTSSAMPLTKFDQLMEDLQTEIESARMEGGE